MQSRCIIPLTGVLMIMLATPCKPVDTIDKYDTAEPDKKIVYKTPVQGDPLELHIFEPAQKGINRPAIVFFFGGGWTGGGPSQFYPHCAYLAKRGMVAISVVYRTMGSHNTSPFECVADGKSAIRWVRAHAGDLGIDPGRIAAGGGSAGGHVAACTGVLRGYDELLEDTRISSRPNAMILFNPVIDTTERGYGANKLRGRETWISPVHHVAWGIPQAIIFHGTADKVVPFENVRRFTLAMEAAGNVCTLVPTDGEGHGFFNYKAGRSNNHFIRTLRAADEFLISLKWLTGKPGL